MLKVFNANNLVECKILNGKAYGVVKSKLKGFLLDKAKR